MVQSARIEDVKKDLRVEPKPGEPTRDDGISGRVERRSGLGEGGLATKSCLIHLEDFAECLAAGDKAAAISVLVERQGAEGGALVEWTPDGVAVILAASGLTAEVPRRSEIAPISSPCSATAPQTCFSMDENRVAVVLLRPGESPLGLIVWGSFKGREESVYLLLLLLRLLCLRPPRSTGLAVRRTSTSRLVFSEDYVPGTSPPMRALYRQLEVLVRSDMPVLVVGETGVGKECIVNILHGSSPRCGGPLVAINCAAIPKDLIEAELFGISRRVATGVDPRPGRFREAEGGTILLDEIGEMMPELQAKLLRALQEKQIQPLGGAPQSFDARIVAATNADLHDRMERGEFRRDLFYRLAGSTIEVPPLRECRRDIARLVDYFLRRSCREAGVQSRGLTARVLKVFVDYPWPGNVRELGHEVRRALFQTADGGTITVARLSSRLVAAAEGGVPASPSASQAEDLKLEPRLREFEECFLREALRRARGRQVRAAKFLGISRNGLAKKLKRFEIDYRDFRSAGESG
jgi:DNA-binding NtrC family response regulator